MARPSEEHLYSVLETDHSKPVTRDANTYTQSRHVLGDYEITASLNEKGMWSLTVRNVRSSYPEVEVGGTCGIGITRQVER